jgi:agmatinase
MVRQVIDGAFTEESFGPVQPEPTFSGALSFCRRRYTKSLEEAELVVSGVPFDLATTNRPGTRFGPRGIRAASAELSWNRNWPWEFDPFGHINTVDYGDCHIDHGRQDAIPDAITAHARHILAADCAMLTFGGDHFITLPLLRAHVEKHGPLSLLHFDAHTDTWSDEPGRIDHGTMFYHAVQEGLVEPANSVQVGIRTINEDTLGFHVLDAAWVHEHGIAALDAEIRRILGDRPTYLTFDIDCVDPAFAPGTGTPVCGGLSSAQALGALRGLRGLNLVGMDLVEVSPPYDHAEVTALLGATLAYEMICLYVTRHKLGER